LCAIHNGGGVGIGKGINCGFGLVLDGKEATDEIIKSAMMWDVLGGVARRAWARNPNAMEVGREVNRKYEGQYHITLPYEAPEDAVKAAVDALFDKKGKN
ncbi:MAG: urocanate hydratase, partial [Synergistaceae bacterium]|nr:urocanate hydratase [Synergistaceae bacterium]